MPASTYESALPGNEENHKYGTSNLKHKKKMLTILDACMYYKVPIEERPLLYLIDLQ